MRRSTRAETRLAVSAVSLAIALIVATAAGGSIIGLGIVNDLAALMERTTETTTPPALKRITTIQVRQFLSDVSATRAMDGLDDGFKNAADNATRFAEVAEEAGAGDERGRRRRRPGTNPRSLRPAL